MAHTEIDKLRSQLKAARTRIRNLGFDLREADDDITRLHHTIAAIPDDRDELQREVARLRALVGERADDGTLTHREAFDALWATLLLIHARVGFELPPANKESKTNRVTWLVHGFDAAEKAIAALVAKSRST